VKLEKEYKDKLNLLGEVVEICVRELHFCLFGSWNGNFHRTQPTFLR
jgi:hypothetical protein